MSKEAWLNHMNDDRSYFSELYFAYFNELLAYGRRIGFDEDTCKDAIQDLFYKIYISENKLKHIQHIEFYLIQSLKNTLFDRYNKERRMQQFNLLEIEPKEEEENCIDQMILEENRKEQEKEIRQLLTKLSPKQRKIIQYRYLMNLSDTEIAALMRMTPDAVKKNIYRALRKMKEAFPAIILLL